MPLSIEQRAASVKALVLDVDGVMTRGDIIYGPDGEWKVFNVQDGHGMVMAREAGVRVGILTARVSEPVKRRAEELKVDLLLEGQKNKATGLRAMLESFGVKPADACFVGDDVVDLPAMRMVGFPVAVANAVDDVKAQAAWVTSRRGGEGAVREVVELILRSSGRWADVMKRYEEAG